MYLTLRAAVVATIGFIIGALTGLTGVGFSSLTAPLLAYLFGLAASRARGAALVLILSAAVPAVIIYAKAGHMNWELAGLVALGMIIGAVIGTRLMSGKSQSIPRKLVALGLAAAGIHIAMSTSTHLAGLHSVPLLEGFAVGFGAGLVGGIAGIAGGVVLIPALVILFAVPQKLAQAVALAVIIPASLPLAAAYYAGGGAVDRKTIVQLSVGGVLGACAGAGMAAQMSSPLITTVFGVFLVVIAAIIFIKS